MRKNSKKKTIKKVDYIKINPADPYMYTDIKSYILRRDLKIYSFLKNRYGKFLAGIIDTMDADYFKKQYLSHKEFIFQFIKEQKDIKEANDLKNSNNPRTRKWGEELIDQIIKSSKQGFNLDNFPE